MASNPQYGNSAAPIIVIVDVRVPKRGQKLARLLHEAGADCYCVSEITYKAPDFRTHEALPAKFVLLIAHDNDRLVWQPLAKRASRVLPYTGGKTPPEDLWSYRSLSPDEARTVVDWAAEGAPDATKPRCFRPKRHHNFLASLAILCQGYLAVLYATDRVENSGVVGLALRRMGWIEFCESGEVETLDMAERLNKALSAVISITWWTDVLDDYEEEDKRAEWLSIRRAGLGEELGEPDEVVPQAGRILAFWETVFVRGEAPEATEVAETYLAISELLTPEAG